MSRAPPQVPPPPPDVRLGMDPSTTQGPTSNSPASEAESASTSPTDDKSKSIRGLAQGDSSDPNFKDSSVEAFLQDLENNDVTTKRGLIALYGGSVDPSKRDVAQYPVFEYTRARDERDASEQVRKYELNSYDNFDLYFFMPAGYIILRPAIQQSSAQRPSSGKIVIIAPNEMFSGPRIGYGWYFKKWIRRGIADGSSIAEMSTEPIAGSPVRLSSTEGCVQVYDDTYLPGNNSNENITTRWQYVMKQIKPISDNDDAEKRTWERIEPFLGLTGNTVFGRNLDNLDAFKNMHWNSTVFRLDGLTSESWGDIKISHHFPSLRAVYTKSYLPSALFSVAVVGLLTIAFVVGYKHPAASKWENAYIALDLVFSGMFAIVIFVASMLDEKDSVLINLLRCRRKIDDVTSRREAERLVKASLTKLAEKKKYTLDKYVDGDVDEWCTMPRGTTTIRTPIGSHAFGKDNLILLSRSMFVVFNNDVDRTSKEITDKDWDIDHSRIRRVHDVSEKVWRLEELDDYDKAALGNEDISKVQLRGLAHVIGKNSKHERPISRCK